MGVLLPLLAAAACSRELPEEKRQRTLPEARQLTLELFQELDGFQLEKQMEVGLAGRPAVRMEASWIHEGQKQRGIIYVLDHPELFNVIHFTTPDRQDLFESGYAAFQKMLRTLKVIHGAGPMAVTEQGDEKVMRSTDLQLEIRYPGSWVYTLDEVNRAVVFSGPKGDSSWLTTISFSVLNKWNP